MTQRSRIVIVGGGIIGCILADVLAPDHDVTVLERDQVAAGATGRSAGLVAPSLFYHDNLPAAAFANEFFRTFDGTNGFAFTQRDRLDFVVAADEPSARESARRLENRGFPVTYLASRAVRESYPGFRLDGFAGAVHYGDTGWVDPHSMAVALRRRAESNGATFETGVSAVSAVAESGRIVGVATDRGDRTCEKAIVAAGWRSRDLLAPQVPLPVRPYRTQCVVLEPDHELADDFPLARFGSLGLYLRPEHNGDLLVGGGSSAADRPSPADRRVDDSFRRRIASTVPEILDGFENARFVDGWAGFDAATPDGRPILDRVAGVEGLLIATGFNGLGVMSSPIARAAIDALVNDTVAPFPIEPFRLDRFGSTDPSFAFKSTSEL